MLGKIVRFAGMERINIEITLDHKVDIDIKIDDIIDGINNCEMKRRWNYIAQIINYVHLSASELTDEQKTIVKNYLESKIKLFS
jgi:hypothetical protein